MDEQEIQQGDAAKTPLATDRVSKDIQLDADRATDLARTLNGGRMVEGAEWFQRTVVILKSALTAAKESERERCANIALAIDSGRGNEKEIAAAIRNPITQPTASASAQTTTVPDRSPASNSESVSPESTSSISWDSVRTEAGSVPHLELFLSAAKATLKYIDNLDERTPVDQNCKVCMGKVFYPVGTPEPPLCFIHQTKAAIKKVENHERSS